MDNGVRFMIHKIGTRKIDLRGTGMKHTMPAPEYWQDTRPNCGQWGDAATATRYLSTRASLPDGGEWVETYVAVTE